MMGGGVPQQQMWGGMQQGGFPYGGGGGGGGGGNFNPATQMNQFTDPNNTTVFVGGLSGYVTEDELRSFFQGFDLASARPVSAAPGKAEADARPPEAKTAEAKMAASNERMTVG